MRAILFVALFLACPFVGADDTDPEPRPKLVDCSGERVFCRNTEAPCKGNAVGPIAPGERCHYNFADKCYKKGQVWVTAKDCQHVFEVSAEDTTHQSQ